MADFRNIRRALEKQLNNIIDLPPIAWENTSFISSDKDSFIRARIQVSQQLPVNVGINSLIENIGVFLVDVFYRRDTATSQIDVTVDNILTAFSYGTFLTESVDTVIIRSSERQGGITDEPWYFVPITINWYSLVN